MQLASNPEAAFLRLHQPQQGHAGSLKLFEAGGQFQSVLSCS